MLFLISILLVDIVVGYHPTSTRKPTDDNLQTFNQAYVTSGYSAVSTQKPSSFASSNYVNSQSSAVNLNNYVNNLSQSSPFGQNGLVKKLTQPLANKYNNNNIINNNNKIINNNNNDNNGFIYDRYANLAPQMGLVNNQNSLLNLLPQNLQVNQNGVVKPLSEVLPVNQNILVRGLTQPAGPTINLSQQSLINSLPGQNSLVSLLPQVQKQLPINQNSLINAGSIYQNGFNLPPQNRYVNPQTLPSQSPLISNNNSNNNNNGFVNPQLSNSNYNNPQIQTGFPASSINPQIQTGFQVSSNNQHIKAPNVGGLEVAFQWRFLDWVHPTVQLTGKNFTVGNPLSQDVDIDKRGRVFITSPQWLEGTPITLSVITNLNGPGGPLLTPYPDWSWHKNDCDGLISVYRVAIDECDRLWMVDTGAASGRPVCPPKLVAFDLNTDQLLLKYIIPEDQTVDRTAQYVNPAIEVGNSCTDTFVYVADVIKHGLLVYSLRENRSYRINNTRGNAFGSDADATRLDIAGESIELNDGTLGVALSPKGFYSKRYLYFNSLASFYQKFTETDNLKRGNLYDPPVYQSRVKRMSQAGVHAISRTGAMFFNLQTYTALACWNIDKPFTPENIVIIAQDQDNLQYTSGIKVIVNAYGEEELWFNTNKLQKTINNSRNINDVNFRLIHGKVDDLIRGTKCEPTGYGRGQPDLQSWRRV